MVYIINYKTGGSNDFFQKERDMKEIRDFGRLYQQMGSEKLQLLLVYLESVDVVSVSM
jgi:hypothetical protein